MSITIETGSILPGSVKIAATYNPELEFEEVLPSELEALTTTRISSPSVKFKGVSLNTYSEKEQIVLRTRLEHSDISTRYPVEATNSS